jgi:hypothetical protein
MMTRRIWAVALLAASVVGCGGSGPSLVSVHGLVTLNGKPLPGASLSFVPDGSNKEGQPGEGVTGPQGDYKAITRGDSGLVPGKYRVVVAKVPNTSQGSDQFNGDPYMAQLSTTRLDPKKTAKKEAATEKIKGLFDREVPAAGGALNFDVTAAIATAAADKPAK